QSRLCRTIGEHIRNPQQLPLPVADVDVAATVVQTKSSDLAKAVGHHVLSPLGFTIGDDDFAQSACGGIGDVCVARTVQRYANAVPEVGGQKLWGIVFSFEIHLVQFAAIPLTDVGLAPAQCDACGPGYLPGPLPARRLAAQVELDQFSAVGVGDVGLVARQVQRHTVQGYVLDDRYRGGRVLGQVYGEQTFIAVIGHVGLVVGQVQRHIVDRSQPLGDHLRATVTEIHPVQLAVATPVGDVGLVARQVQRKAIGPPQPRGELDRGFPRTLPLVEADLVEGVLLLVEVEFFEFEDLVNTGEG